MITLVIYGVIAIALASAAGYAFMSFSSSSRQLTQLQENSVQMSTAAAALRASLLALSNNGVVYAPIGTAGANYTQLPATLGVVAAAPWGQPYLYCPVSQTGTTNQTGQALTAGTVTSQSGATYAINTLSNSLTQGNSYVITNATANAPPVSAGYVAFIVSTLGPGQTMPDCSKITVGANGPSVAGGSVRGVTAGFSFLQRVSASSDKMEVYVGSAATGDGSGRDTNNLATIDNAMALWSALQPRLGMIYLENSLTTTSSFNAQDFSGLDIRGQNAGLVIETDPTIAGGGVKTLTLSTNLSLPAATTFQNVNVIGPSAIYAYKPLTFRHVTYTGPAANTTMNVYGADLMVNDSSLNGVNLYATNAHVSFMNDNTTATSFKGVITATNSNITFEPSIPTIASVAYTVTPTAGVVFLGADSNVTIGAPSGPTTTVTTTGQFQMNGGNFALNSTGTLTSTNTTNSPAILGTGTTISVNGALQANTGTGSAIRVTASTITGSGNLKVYAVSNPCIGYYSTGATLVPIYLNAAAATAAGYSGFAIFAGTSQYGYPPLPSNAPLTPSAADTAEATSLTSVNGTDPVITGGAANVAVTAIGPAGGSINANAAYLGATTFEAGVRSIVNQEFRPGLNLYFTGTCAP